MFAQFNRTQLNLARELIVMEYEKGLLYKDGRFERLLDAGRYRFWRWEKVDVIKVSMRQMREVISGQEILTSDRIEVRVSLVAKYQIADPVVAINNVDSYTEQLYQDIQLELRNSVASRTIDQLLEARQELSDELLARVAPQALTYGVTLLGVGVRDMILPGQVRAVFMKEVEADRQGRADLIKARHEVAAARARANTAKILTENPAVLRLQEIDALLALADKSGNVIVLPNIADMLTQRSSNDSSGA
ncbi:MAG: hypothetical protein OHK0046_04200 [Anaerolineae bacterium]